MERKLMSELLKWKDKKGRKPLLLEGARQVGKTWYHSPVFDSLLDCFFNKGVK